MSKRKQYTKEFKQGAVSLVLEQNYSRREAGASLGVHGTLISRWVHESQEQGEKDAFRGHGQLSEEQALIRRLEEENKRLRMEKEILKKAAAFFAQETN